MYVVSNWLSLSSVAYTSDDIDTRHWTVCIEVPSVTLSNIIVSKRSGTNIQQVWMARGGKGKGSVKSPDSMTTHVQHTLLFPWQGGRQCSLQLLIQPWICAPGTHYVWMNQGSVGYEVCPTLLHMASTANRTPDHLDYSWSTKPACPQNGCSKE